MKCRINQVSAFLLFSLMTPITVMANWQMAQPQTVAPKDPFFQAGIPQRAPVIPRYKAPVISSYKQPSICKNPATPLYRGSKISACQYPTRSSYKPYPQKNIISNSPSDPILDSLKNPRIASSVKPIVPVIKPILYAMSVSGSLKENLERIMKGYHWKIIWKSPYDYNFDGRVSGNSLADAVEKLLKPFPLQAKLYMSNRTMVVVSRSL